MARKKILLRVKEDEFSSQTYKFYIDGTYRVGWWTKDMPSSKWDILRGSIHEDAVSVQVFHPGENDIGEDVWRDHDFELGLADKLINSYNEYIANLAVENMLKGKL